MKKISIKNSKKEENKSEEEKEEEKKENVEENKINEENINNEKNIFSETQELKSQTRNKKIIEREGTDINLFSPRDIGTNNNIQKNIYDEKNLNEEIKENLESTQKNNDINLDKVSETIKINEGEKLRFYGDLVRIKEDSCDKCPLRSLIFIPICFGYLFLSLFDFLTYLIVPLVFCLFYTIVFICNYCRNIISNYQVEEEIGFSGAFTSENEIKIHVADEGGVLHLNEILCFSYMSACVKRYFCFIFVLINHVLVPVLQAWKRAKDCLIKSEVEVLYDERMVQINEAKKYSGFAQAEPQIEINNV